ncbi:hypothetical protein BKA64DRAFT_284846 [Cadophora sp. MPI-SDFR-AT-0126]|nr:hypothetical protein BKA64DRAFT_284846 [Leotiomycetes sp. MPI-SDFR-AT-0126]
MFDSFLPHLSRDWIQAGLQLDDDYEIEEAEQPSFTDTVPEVQTEARERGKGNTRSCKLYRALHYRRIGQKLVSFAKNAIHVPDAALRDARDVLRNCKAKLMHKTIPAILHEHYRNRVTQYFRYESELACQVFCHDRTFPEEVQDRKYAFARLLGVIGNDPAPMPALEHGTDIGPWYQELERRTLQARANRTGITDLDMRQRADYFRSQSERVCDAISNTSPTRAEPSEVSSQIDAGEGPSSGPVRTLRRCDPVDLNAWKEANRYSSDEGTPQSEAVRSEIRGSNSSNTIRCGHSDESSLTSSGSQRQAAYSKSRLQNISLDSRLHELHELEERRKTELHEEIAGIGSGIIVRDEFQETHSPSMSGSSSSGHNEETRRNTAFPEDSEGAEIVQSAGNDRYFGQETSLRDNIHHQDNSPDAILHRRPEPSNLAEPIGALRRPGFLETLEEESLVRRDLQRLNKRVVQGRGAFARESGSTTPKQGMSIDMESST